MSGNREYKSDVFSMLMEDSKNALDLYNALNGSHYDDPSQVEMNTLERGISLTVRNDASFVLDGNLSVYEHQSTVCPNIPVRGLVYFSNLLEPMVKKKNAYGRTPIIIPTPHFAVFYNGNEEQPETYKYRLSDLFSHPVENPEAEIVCTVYNINYGKNRELLEKCGFLKEYMIFVDYVRQIHRENNYQDLEYCIHAAICRCIKENVLRQFLIERGPEVMKVVYLDYSFERQIMLEREENIAEGREMGLEEGRKEGREEGRKEGREEGRKEGREEGRKEGHEKGLAEGRLKEIFISVQEGDYDVARGAEKLHVSIPEFEKRMKDAGYSIPEQMSV